MLKKSIVVVIALFLLLGAILGAGRVLAQEAEDVPAFPYGPGHMWQWQQDGETPAPPYGHGGMMRGGWMMDGNTLLDVVAATLDLSADEVWTELSQGISIAELAEAHDVAPQTIVDNFLESHATSLQEAVEAGWLTQEQADWMQQNMAASLEARLNQPWAGGFGPGAGRGYGPGAGGCHGFDADGAAPFGPRGRGMRGGWGNGWQQPAAPQGNGA